MTDTTNLATLGISATEPATYDAVGYDALTFVTVANIVDVGEIAKIFAEVAHQRLDLNYPEKNKGTYNIANVPITLGRVIADAGQVIVQAGLAATTSYSFKVTYGSTNVAEFTAKIMKAGTGAIAPDGIETTMLDLSVDPQSLFEV